MITAAPGAAAHPYRKRNISYPGWAHTESHWAVTMNTRPECQPVSKATVITGRS